MNQSRSLVNEATGKINAKNKMNTLVEQILDMVAQGEFRAGDRLPPENELSTRFGVSRATLRESFKQLSAMGVISIRQGEGTFVNKMTPSSVIEPLVPLMPLMLLEMNDDDIDEIFEARICLESGIAQMAAKNRTEEDLQRLRGILAAMDQCLSEEDFDRYSKLDVQFHSFIAEASKNKIMINMYMLLNEVRMRSILMSNLSIASISYSIFKHREILRALEQRDVANIASIMSTHLTFARQMNLEVIRSESVDSKGPAE